MKFQDKPSMTRRANVLWAILMIAPANYLWVVFFVSLHGPLASSDTGFTQLLFVVLLILSGSNLGFVVFTQIGKRFQPSLASKDPIGWVFMVLAIGSILSETFAIYGFLLSLLSGSLAYAVGFSLASWASLIWVRIRFTQNLERLP